jgi:hypothetical protein
MLDEIVQQFKFLGGSLQSHARVPGCPVDGISRVSGIIEPVGRPLCRLEGARRATD